MEHAPSRAGCFRSSVSHVLSAPQSTMVMRSHLGSSLILINNTLGYHKWLWFTKHSALLYVDKFTRQGELGSLDR